MHELGVVFHIIKGVEKAASDNGLTDISSVTVQLGQVSTVIPRYLTDCWQWAVKKTELLRDTKLHIDVIPAVTYCEGCQGTYDTIAHGKICPLCGSEKTWLLQGSEVSIKEIEGR